MFYLFACTVTDQSIETADELLARGEKSKPLIDLAGKLNAVECYVMNANDVVIWASFPLESKVA